MFLTREKYSVMSNNRKLHHRFRDYPFNFHPSGKLRKSPQIPQEDFEYWLRLVARSSLGATTVPDPPSASTMLQEQTP